jgi:hypothetical protein
MRQVILCFRINRDTKGMNTIAPRFYQGLAGILDTVGAAVGVVVIDRRTTQASVSEAVGCWTMGASTLYPGDRALVPLWAGLKSHFQTSSGLRIRHCPFIPETGL